jgi:FkbM family methyltransferase
MTTRYAKPLGREVELRPGTTDEQIFHEAFVKQFHVPPETISPATVLDLGCNIGLTVAHFEALWPDADIIGVDLDADNCVVARRNCRRARILNVAVSAISGTQTYSGEEAWSFRLDPSGDRAVEARTLDELTDLLGGRADFVKMDIEGAEWEVVKAPGEWPERIGSLLIEIHGTEGRRQAGIDEMMGYLRNKGFTCRKHEALWSAVWAKRERGKPARRRSPWLLWSSRGTPVLSSSGSEHSKGSLGARA